MFEVTEKKLAVLYDGTNSEEIVDKLVEVSTPYGNPEWIIVSEDVDGLVLNNVRYGELQTYPPVATGSYVLIDAKNTYFVALTPQQFADWYVSMPSE